MNQKLEVSEGIEPPFTELQSAAWPLRQLTELGGAP